MKDGYSDVASALRHMPLKTFANLENTRLMPKLHDTCTASRSTMYNRKKWIQLMGALIADETKNIAVPRSSRIAIINQSPPTVVTLKSVCLSSSVGASSSISNCANRVRAAEIQTRGYQTLDETTIISCEFSPLQCAGTDDCIVQVAGPPNISRAM